MSYAFLCFSKRDSIVQGALGKEKGLSQKENAFCESPVIVYKNSFLKYLSLKYLSRLILVVQRLNNHRNTLATADTKGYHAVAAFAFAQLVNQGSH